MERLDLIRDYHDSKVLVVDDDPLNVDVLHEILMSEGYTSIVTTTQPKEAINLYRENEFDLVLLDILMPEIDGFGVMNHFNEVKKDNDIPILILSALSDHNTRVRALNLGARDFLTKPFNTDEVLVRIRNLLEVKLAQEQLLQHNAILDQKIQERTKELRDTQLEIVNKLGIAAEYRDNETGLHIIRMSQFSYEIAKTFGYSEKEAELILNSAPMHDIGKIGIPDSILLKPGKLNNEEWEIMKNHTTIGAKILRGHHSDLLQTAVDIALTHHERWDGNGYPNGLIKEEIPVPGRIISIADVFDALTSVRPYKKSWSVEKSMEAIEKNSGKQFDPELVKVFQSCLPKILKIKEKYMDQFPDHQPPKAV